MMSTNNTGTCYPHFWKTANKFAFQSVLNLTGVKSKILGKK